jgi:hypothetical protein
MSKWKEQTFAAREATKHHRTEGVRTKQAFAAAEPMSAF